MAKELCFFQDPRNRPLLTCEVPDGEAGKLAEKFARVYKESVMLERAAGRKLEDIYARMDAVMDQERSPTPTEKDDEWLKNAWLDMWAMRERLDELTMHVNAPELRASRRLERLLRLDTPLPLYGILVELRRAAVILLHRQDYDGDGHETIRDAVRAVLPILTMLGEWRDEENTDA